MHSIKKNKKQNKEYKIFVKLARADVTNHIAYTSADSVIARNSFSMCILRKRHCISIRKANYGIIDRRPTCVAGLCRENFVIRRDSVLLTSPQEMELALVTNETVFDQWTSSPLWKHHNGHSKRLTQTGNRAEFICNCGQHGFIWIAACINLLVLSLLVFFCFSSEVFPTYRNWSKETEAAPPVSVSKYYAPTNVYTKIFGKSDDSFERSWNFEGWFSSPREAALLNRKSSKQASKELIVGRLSKYSAHIFQNFQVIIRLLSETF